MENGCSYSIFHFSFSMENENNGMYTDPGRWAIFTVLSVPSWLLNFWVMLNNEDNADTGPYTAGGRDQRVDRFIFGSTEVL